MPAGNRSTLARSIRLLNAFRHEQHDPDRFYAAVAEDVVAQLGAWTSLDGALVVDVGSGRGHFRAAFREARATYVGCDVDGRELAQDAGPRFVGDGRSLPLRSSGVDVCCSLSALEHTPDPWRVADEMVRVTRPDGLVLISYTVWWGPWGGHETTPWHYLGGHRARRRYERRHGVPPKNAFGTTLFAVSARAGLRWARARERAGVVDVVDVFPRYHPRWSHWLLSVPLLRELLTWNVVIVVRPR